MFNLLLHIDIQYLDIILSMQNIFVLIGSAIHVYYCFMELYANTFLVNCVSFSQCLTLQH